MHLAGNLTKKQNVFDDFAAAARHLVERNYTARQTRDLGESKMAASDGATVTSTPIVRAVVARVGIYDMLRVEVGPMASSHHRIRHCGRILSSSSALYAYSPYHHIVQGGRYPAIFLATGENDGRVEPWQSRKFAAAMQAATGSGLPVACALTHPATAWAHPAMSGSRRRRYPGVPVRPARRDLAGRGRPARAEIRLRRPLRTSPCSHVGHSDVELARLRRRDGHDQERVTPGCNAHLLVLVVSISGAIDR